MSYLLSDDTTSYPYGIGKIKTFKKMLSLNKVNLLSKFGDSLASAEDLNNARIFMQTTLYAGKLEEGLIQRRSKIFAKQRQSLACSYYLIQIA